jgi:hypothetical protein
LTVEDLQPCTAYVTHIQTVNPTNLRTPAEYESFQLPWSVEDIRISKYFVLHTQCETTTKVSTEVLSSDSIKVTWNPVDGYDNTVVYEVFHRMHQYDEKVTSSSDETGSMYDTNDFSN